MRRAGLLTVILIAVALTSTDRVAAGPGFYPVDLQVAGGEDSWHADGLFQLTWERPRGPEGDLPIATVGYRVRDATGAIVIPITRLPGDRTGVDIRVPTQPGLYTAELWLEEADQERGPVRSVTLRYDDARPGTARPHAPPDWIAGSTSATVSIQPPAGPPPVSGIRGYAISIDRGGESWPCATRNRCEEADIDLRADAADVGFSLGTLPEGSTVVRALAVSGSGVPSAAAGSAVVRVDATPPAVTATGVPPGWSSGPVSLLARATDDLSGMALSGPNGPYTAIAVDGGVPRTALGDSADVTVAGEGIHRVELHARDEAGNVGNRSAGTATIAIDESPPQLSFAAKQDPAEPERIEAVIADALSGVDPDRGSIGVREAGTSQAWQSLRTTATDGRLIARWDSDRYPEGIYEFRATGYDRAGNVAATSQRENHARMVLVNPLKSRARLQAGLTREMRPSARAPYGRGLVYTGQVSAAGGSPLGGLPVQITESFEPGAAAGVRSSRVVTAADGSFTIRLSPGPSRQVEARFSGTSTYGSAQSGQARIEVLAAVRMRASSRTARVGGAPIVFRGRVGNLGARLPRSGLPVELQFRVPGGEWAEFRTVQTARDGRFRYRYAFSDDDSRGVRFQFRAYMSGGDWPYAPAASKAVSVTGR